MLRFYRPTSVSRILCQGRIFRMISHACDMHSYNSRKTNASIISDDILMGNMLIDFGRPQLTRWEKQGKHTQKPNTLHTPSSSWKQAVCVINSFRFFYHPCFPLDFVSFFWLSFSSLSNCGAMGTSTTIVKLLHLQCPPLSFLQWWLSNLRLVWRLPGLAQPVSYTHLTLPTNREV